MPHSLLEDPALSPMTRRAAALAALAAALLADTPVHAKAPKEGECPEISPSMAGPDRSEDATPIKLEEGMILIEDDLLILRQLIPKEIWNLREVFFHEGMRMEIGPCHRRYALPKSYRDATERYAGQPRIDRKGNLVDYSAGLPFPPDDIDPNAKDAATRWAFDLQQRYRGAGFRGKFRIADFPSSVGRVMKYEGEFYLIQTRHRADLAESDYALADSRQLFASGGEFFKPFDARNIMWRQFRTTRNEKRHTEPDDIFVYVPTMRKMRRSATSWVDGLFLPRYSVAGDSGGGGIAIGGGGAGGFGAPTGAINPTAGLSIAVTEDMRRGLTGLTLRANAYQWRFLGEVDVLAPINGSRTGYPIDKERNFGVSGLSVASDRWDVRHAAVIEGALRLDNEDVRSLTVYVDYQTQQPLFWITRTGRRRLLDIGILVHRFSDDQVGYPQWPGGTLASVFEPVAAVFYTAGSGGGGWRRESYELLSTPFSEAEQRRFTTTDAIQHGH
ncbi:MAG: DUF1329 domain-containing protein [Deltaproteobacteria bacterium]|nr:DUF1329 domain-containing protein [Deltaproteobacteria bacterium]MBW2419361.1 DUF1329 domain-containing protein [Deltaproteobacteria bacterium]